ncbi:MAG: class 3 adenylate cyclase [Alphaproteobacteria bacterium]|jgi:class 3 adenylate cyclase
MSAGFEVCIHRDGRWEIYSFFDDNQENDAIYQARDISNNYSSVCVLWSSKMRVSYFKSRDSNIKQPTYMDVRSDLKLGHKKQSKPTPIIKSIPKLKKQKEKPKKTEDPLFTEKDKQRAIMNSALTGFIGFILTFFSPSLLSADANSAMQAIVMGTTFILSIFLSYIVYQVTEQASRLHNQKENMDSDIAWKTLGLSKDTLEKLASEQIPEMKNAISAAMPDIAAMNIKNKKASANSFSPQTSGAKVKDAASTSPSIQKADTLNDNSKFSVTQPQENKNQSEESTALAEASLRELLTEMCRTIKSVSYDKETDSLKETHDLAATLYLCGGASYAIRHLNLPQNLVGSSVPMLLTRIDVNPEISTGFVQQLSNYIHTPRHAILFDRGVADAKTYIENSSAPLTYEDALKKWIALQSEASPNSFFASIIFTDIEGFTESTRVHGDKWMIDVLHAHNDIVRKVLAQFRGQEIKHTGDGILAMFNNVSKAVEAAIAIQRGFDLFCKAMPSREFKARIGIGAGDIVSIDGDIFGGSVNLTARIMSLAVGGQIAITESVHGIVKNGEHIFTDLGEQELKGCKKQHIHLVNWTKINQSPEQLAKELTAPTIDQEKSS